MAENKSRFSNFKSDFKKYNQANQDDYRQLIQCKIQSKQFEFRNLEKQIKNVPDSQPQQSQQQSLPQQPIFPSQPEIPNARQSSSQQRNNPISDQLLPNQNQSSQLNNGFIPNRNQPPQSVNRDESDEEEEEQKQIINPKSVSNNSLTSNKSAPNEIPSSNQSSKPQLSNKIFDAMKDKSQQPSSQGLDNQNKNKRDSNQQRRQDQPEQQQYQKYENKYQKESQLPNNQYGDKQQNQDNQQKDSSEQNANQVQVSQTQSKGPKIIKWLSLQDIQLIISDSSVYTLGDSTPQTSLFQKKVSSISLELDQGKLQEICKVPAGSLIYDASIHDQLLCLQIERVKETDPNVAKFGLIFLNFTLETSSPDKVGIVDCEVQTFNEVDFNKICCLDIDMQNEMFILASKGGYLYFYSFDMELLFRYLVPNDHFMNKFLYLPQPNEDNSINIEVYYSTNANEFSKLNLLKNENGLVVLSMQPQIDEVQVGKITHLSLSIDQSKMLILHSQGGKYYASVYNYPSLTISENFETIPSHQFVTIYDFVQSQLETYSNCIFFGLLSNDTVAVYCYKISQSKHFSLQNNQMFLKKIGYSPQSFHFSLEFFQGSIIKIFTSNPDRVNDDDYSNNYARLIVESLQKEQQSI